MIRTPPSAIPLGFASHALQLLQKVQHGLSAVELVHVSHEHWPFRPGHATQLRPSLHISVLDASFNPPTLAHLALANSRPPSFHQRSPATSAPAESYDTRMLLLSVHNADKVLKPGDATFLQRLEMMRLLSHDMHAVETAESSGESSKMTDNVAIAVIDEPTFVGKSTVLLHFLRKRLATFAVESPSSPSGTSNEQDASCPFPSPKLTFLLGFDTLLRLCSPKYYPSEQVMIQMLQMFLSPDQEDCHIACAHRRIASTDKTLQETQDTMKAAQEFITNERIVFIDIGTEEQTYSSSEVRAKVAVGDGQWQQLVTNRIANYIVDHGLYSSSGGKQ